MPASTGAKKRRGQAETGRAEGGQGRKDPTRQGQTSKRQSGRRQPGRAHAANGQAGTRRGGKAQLHKIGAQTARSQKSRAQGGQNSRTRGQGQRSRTQAFQTGTSRARILIPLLIVLAIIGFATVKYVSGRVSEGAASSAEDPASKYLPVECTPDMVDVSMSARLNLDGATDTAPPPTPVIFTVTLHNLSDEHPCYLQVGRDAAAIDVTSGSDAITSLSTCEGAGSAHKQLLIDRGMETSFEWTWNGRRGEGCAGDAELAKEGTYKGMWRTKDGTTAESVAVFELPDLAPKPPEPAPE